MFSNNRALGWGAVCFGVFLLFLPSRSMAESAPLYDLSGTVTSVVHHSGWIYRIQSDENAYTMVCEKSRLREVRCDWNGRSIAVGDRVQFRLKGTTAYLPSGAHQEERLFVSMTEFAQLRPLPVVPEGYLGAVVSGEGYALDGQPSASASAPDSTGIPVTAVPVTGGAPVTVIPVAPSAGPVITGVPVTGGAPMTAIDVSAPASMTASSASRAQLIHVLRVQSVGKIYDLACAERNCTLQGRAIGMGDPLALRFEKKRVYVSRAGTMAERRFDLLATYIPEAMPH